MTAFTITYSLWPTGNASSRMSVASFAHGIDQAAGQACVTLARRYGR
jgi:hypothetical protein